MDNATANKEVPIRLDVNLRMLALYGEGVSALRQPGMKHYCQCVALRNIQKGAPWLSVLKMDTADSSLLSPVAAQAWAVNLFDSSQRKGATLQHVM
jgi:hypothetical protein